MAVYPDAIKTFTNPINSNTLASPSHATQHTDANNEITAIQTELGTNPKGSYASVKARLDAIGDIDQAVIDAQAAAADAAVAATAAEAAAENFEFASQTEAEAGVNTTKSMNPLRTAQAIAVLAPIPTDYVKNDGTVNPLNLLSNGDFEVWSAGTSVAPDRWALTGSGASVAIDNDDYVSAYSAKITRAGTDCYLAQNVENSWIGGFDASYWYGKKVTFTCYVKATVASRARLKISDGVGSSVSTYHTGGSGWEKLEVTHTISGSATMVQAQLVVDTGDTSALFDGAILVEGEAAFAFSPKPVMEGFGTWAARSDNTVYQAATDGFLIGVITAAASVSAGKILGYTDASNPPTTIRASAFVWVNTGAADDSEQLNYGSFCMPVKRGDYYKGVLSNHVGANAASAAYYWIPLGI